MFNSALKEPVNVALLGWREAPGMVSLLRTFDALVAPGSRLLLLAEESLEDREDELNSVGIALDGREAEPPDDDDDDEGEEEEEEEEEEEVTHEAAGKKDEEKKKGKAEKQKGAPTAKKVAEEKGAKPVGVAPSHIRKGGGGGGGGSLLSAARRRLVNRHEGLANVRLEHIVGSTTNKRVLAQLPLDRLAAVVHLAHELRGEEDHEECE